MKKIKNENEKLYRGHLIFTFSIKVITLFETLTQGEISEF